MSSWSPALGFWTLNIISDLSSLYFLSTLYFIVERVELLKIELKLSEELLSISFCLEVSFLLMSEGHVLECDVENTN